MKNFNKLIIIILGLNFLISLGGIFLLSSCEPNTKYLFALPECNPSTTYTCLWCKEGLFSDFYYQYNTLKYTGVHGTFPNIGVPNDVDGGFDGASFFGEDTRIIYHSPLYYYLAGFIYVLAKSININDLLVLHIFSTVIALFTNILFFFLVKKISKRLPRYGSWFVVTSLVLFVFMPTPLHMGIAVQSDIMFHLSIIASFLMYLCFIENKTLKNAIYLGLVVGLSSLISMGGIVILVALFFYMIKFYIKKEHRERNLMIFSFIIALISGILPWVRNYLLTGNPYGDMHSRGLQVNSFIKLFYKFYSGNNAFWGGIYGGISQLKPLLMLVSAVLMLLALMGLVFYFKRLRKEIDLDFIILTYFFTVIFLVTFICNPFMFLSDGVCYGREIQNRFMISLTSLIPLFSGIALIKLKEKKPCLKHPINLFIILACLVFAVEFIVALA